MPLDATFAPGPHFLTAPFKAHPTKKLGSIKRHKLHSVPDLKPSRVSQVASVLQQLQKTRMPARATVNLDEPPPPYSPATLTSPPTAAFFVQRPQDEIDEMIR